MTHKTELLAWFRRGLSITPAEAVDRFRNYRLADTVLKLRREGHQIHTELMESVNADGRKSKYARYHYLCGPKGETVPTQDDAPSEAEHNFLRSLWRSFRGGDA